ncbi:hypothetical protein EIP86_002701 [Pleurotus ostreatoroseus]|nr:hypothetical protein EIP86_002701 [Pleurotus ostreatoroseus]
MPVNPRHVRRQLSTTSASGLGGASVASGSPTETASLILATGGTASDSFTFSPSLVSPVVTSTSASSPASASQTATSAGVKSDSIAISTVVGACVGTFAGLALLISLFVWCTRHASTKARNMPRSPVAAHRNARGEAEQERTRSGLWNKLDDDAMPPATRQMSQREIDEKNFPMFKKRSPSTRTTKTAKVLADHGIDMPPLELSKYHPHLAEELALQSPDRPFAAAAQAPHRQESGVSWDGETVGDDSFLSLRSVRIESGAISPTLAMAKMTPPAMSPLHRWESAEVLSMDAPSSSVYAPTASLYAPSATSSQAALLNPFADHAMVEPALATADADADARGARERRKSSVNPFFGHADTDAYRMSRRMSRSNSRTRRSASRSRDRDREYSRAVAMERHTSMRATVVSGVGEMGLIEDMSMETGMGMGMGANPFADARDADTDAAAFAHGRSDSIASGASGAFHASHRAMESLIAALDLSKDEVEDRLRAASTQPSLAERESVVLYGEEGDIGLAHEFPPTPTTPTAPLARR